MSFRRGLWSDPWMPWQLSRRCQQHNVHHARTNEVGIDEDIATDPALFLWAPDPKNDAPWRKYQGAYLPLPMSMLFLVSCFHPRLSSCCFPIFLSSGNTGRLEQLERCCSESACLECAYQRPFCEASCGPKGAGATDVARHAAGSQHTTRHGRSLTSLACKELDCRSCVACLALCLHAGGAPLVICVCIQ